jgi:two-component sensor histidine kinase
MRVFILFLIFFVIPASADGARQALALSHIASSQTKTLSLLPWCDIAVVPQERHRGAPPGPTAKFTPLGDAGLEIGYGRYPIWLRFHLVNDTATPRSVTLSLTNQMLEHAWLYLPGPDGWKLLRRGLLDRARIEGHIRPTFTLSLAPGERRRCYLRLASRTSTLSTEILAGSAEACLERERRWFSAVMLFVGAMGALILYNLAIFLFTRDRAYLYYVLYHAAAVLNYLSYTCVTNLLLPRSWWEADGYLGIVYLGATTLFALLFVRSFLDTGRFPRLDLLLKALMSVQALLIFLGFWNLPAIFPLAIALGTLSLLFSLGVALLLWRKKVHNARLLVAGWIFANVGWTLLALQDTGLLPAPLQIPYLYEGAMFAEALLFSMALADKLNLTGRLQRALARNELLLKELNHRVKNNMQLILSLYRIKFRELECPGLDEKLREIEGVLQSMRDIHENFYADEQEGTVDLSAHIRHLADHIRRGYRREDVAIDLRVEGEAHIPEAVFIGLVVNELFVNAFRHGLAGKGGRIRLTLETRDKRRYMVVEDDGKGCEKEAVREGFGLELVRSIVEQELHGTLRIAEEGGGCRIEMSWEPLSTPGLSPA